MNSVLEYLNFIGSNSTEGKEDNLFLGTDNRNVDQVKKLVFLKSEHCPKITTNRFNKLFHNHNMFYKKKTGLLPILMSLLFQIT